MQELFLLSFVWLAWAFLGFPVLLLLVARLRPAPSHSRWGYGPPEVTVMFTLGASTDCPLARAEKIRERVRDLRNNGYPLDRLQILAVSDGPLPGLRELEAELRGPRLGPGGAPDFSILDLPLPAGKTAAQNAAVRQAMSECLVFTDADTRLRRGALAALVEPLADPAVGCASGRLQYLGDSIEGLYWSYESWLKWAEDRIVSLLGANGALYAVRKTDFAELPAFALADLVEPLYQLCQNRRTVWVPEAVALEELPGRPLGDVFGRKRRISLRALSSLPLIWPVLNLRERPVVAILFASHKLLRWFSWLPLLGLYFSSFVLASDPFFARLALAQLVFYLYGGGIYAGLPLAGLPAYILEVMTAQLVATVQWMIGRREPAWLPTASAVRERTAALSGAGPTA